MNNGDKLSLDKTKTGRGVASAKIAGEKFSRTKYNTGKIEATMEATRKKDNLLIELSVLDNKFEFNSYIDTELNAAQEELDRLDEKIQESLESIKELTPECDKTDYALATSMGALCGIIDIFLVGKPDKSPIGEITDKWFEDRTKDFAKLCGWKDDGNSTSSAISYLEKKFKVPYDQRGAGDAGSFIYDLNPTNHHFKSVAHNPTLLGLFFSILDQFSNQSHFISNGDVIALQEANNSFKLRGSNVPSKLFCAIVNWLGHLMSDITGSASSSNRGMGIPSPLLAWTNDIIAIKKMVGIPVYDIDKSINELALNIYKKGYDTRFQTAQAIPVFINEILVRFIYSIRRLIKYFQANNRSEYSFKAIWQECEPFKNASVKRMLTVAHGTFCLLDISDAVIRSYYSGKGNFDVEEFAMRLNIIGFGRFTISLYGEVSRKIEKKDKIENTYFLKREKIIVDDYIEGLKSLSEIYDDKELITFVNDFSNSDLYKNAFDKSAKLAKMRNVSKNKILESKDDIDCYFKGGK